MDSIFNSRVAVSARIRPAWNASRTAWAFFSAISASSFLAGLDYELEDDGVKPDADVETRTA